MKIRAWITPRPPIKPLRKYCDFDRFSYQSTWSIIISRVQNWNICLNFGIEMLPNLINLKALPVSAVFWALAFQERCLHHIQKELNWKMYYSEGNLVVLNPLFYNPESRIIFFPFSWILSLGRDILTTMFPR